MTEKKLKLGQFYTKESLWLKPQIADFIRSTACTTAYDPFAGEGDLLRIANTFPQFKQLKGLDIDPAFGWEYNDSLKDIPSLENAVIITNPPYLAKQSASRKKLDLSEYFSQSNYDDIYLIALDKMLAAQHFVVAIIPESFLNSNYRWKNRLVSITILEENPFTDTENPVCVACFDKQEKSFSEITVYKNNRLINSLENIYKIRLAPQNNIKIVFNSLDGWLGLRAIDGTKEKTVISFAFKETIPYDWEHNIKNTSRHLTLIDLPVPIAERNDFIFECNRLLQEIRISSDDILLTPFKGNTKKGIRRRRLDFCLARAIMETAYFNTVKGIKCYEQQRIF